jgi:hypothetical protein
MRSIYGKKMKSSKALAVGLMTVMFLILAPAGHSGAATLQGLFDGDFITAGDMLFDDWNLTGATPGIDLNKIQVRPFSLGPTNSILGFLPGGQIQVDGTGQLELRFTYTVTAVGAMIDGNSLGTLFYSIGPSGFAEIKETAYDRSGDIFDPAKRVYRNPNDPVSQVLFDHRDFDPVSLMIVDTSITIEGDREEDFVGILGYLQHFTQVPIPGSVWMLSAGLLALIVIRRRHR